MYTQLPLEPTGVETCITVQNLGFDMENKDYFVGALVACPFTLNYPIRMKGSQQQS
jgi:hypothetical protein